MSGGSRCCFGVMALLVQILLHGELALTLYWIVQYRWNAQGFPFAFRGSEEGDLDKQWNLHPVLMITGFIYCMGQGRKKIWLNIMNHQSLKVWRNNVTIKECWCIARVDVVGEYGARCSTPCFTCWPSPASWWASSLPGTIMNCSLRLPSLTSTASTAGWVIILFLVTYQYFLSLGLATMAMFLLQFVSGVFSFLLLMCCSSSTASFRSSMVPIHSSLGTTTFLMAIATCIAGITETALFKLR